MDRIVDIHHHSITPIRAQKFNQCSRCRPLASTLDKVNHLRSGVGRFGASMLRRGLAQSGAVQTADHVISGVCPVYHLPGGVRRFANISDLIIRTFNSAADIWV
ncbi:hypothetical protein LSAT2_016146 [Lamellibrachia satsuma]|nr:hypothetical protein LSAT2_016146 [Lamellibrachia satsuma]